MSIFKKINKASKRYWKPNLETIKITEPSIDNCVDILLRIREKLYNNENSTVDVVLRKFWYVIQQLGQRVGQKHTNINKTCLNALADIASDTENYPHQFNEYLEDINECINKLKDICNNTIFGNSKGIKVRNEILTQYNQNERKIVVFHRHNDTAASLNFYLNPASCTCEIRAYEDLSDLDFDHVAVIPSWPGYKRFRKLFASGLFRKFIIVGYEHELASSESFFSKIHWFPSKNTLTCAEKIRVMGEKIESWPEKSKVLLNDKVEKIATMLEDNTVIPKKYDFGPIRPNDHLVVAYYCDLSGGHMTYLTESFVGSVIVIRDQEIKVKELPRFELDEGNILLFRGGSDESIVSSLVDKTYTDAIELRNIAKIWKIEIQEKFKNADTLHRSIIYNGGNTTKTTATNWYNGWLLIAPEEANIDIIAKVLGATSKTYQRINDIKIAADKLKQYHKRVGSVITDMLKSNITKWRGNIGEEGAIVELPGVGTINLVRIENISSESTQIPRSKTNTLLTEQ